MTRTIMTVFDLTREQLDELKEAYFYAEETADILPDYITSPTDIPDDIILEHYNGISFVPDDFWCSMERFANNPENMAAEMKTFAERSAER